MSIEDFDSAENAFKSLNIGSAFDKRHAARRCKEVEKLINHGAWSKSATALDYCTIFRNSPHNCSLPFVKSLKMGQVNGTQTVALFSDEYGHRNEADEKLMIDLKSTCAAGGISIVPFIKRYTPNYTDDDFTIDTKKVKMICTGYKNLYRGNLCGFYIL